MIFKRKVKIIIAFLIIILCMLLLYYFNEDIKSVVNIVLFSFILSYIFIPIRNIIEEKFKLSRKISSVIIVVSILLIIICGIIILIPQLFDEISNIGYMINNITSYSEKIYKELKLDKVPFLNDVYMRMIEKSKYMISKFSDASIEKIIIYSNSVFSVAVIPIIIYYFLCDGCYIFNKIMLLVPADKRGLIKRIISDIDRALSRYIAGQFFLCIIISVVSFVIFIIFKMKFVVWLSIINGIFNIIPYFGPIFGAAPAIFIAFIDSPLKGINVAVSLIILQQIEGNILSPKITGDSIDIHPFGIIILLLIGDSIGGFIGMILIIPLAVIIKVLYIDINYYLF